MVLKTSGIVIVLYNQSDKPGYISFYKYSVIFLKNKICIFEALIILVK